MQMSFAKDFAPRVEHGGSLSVGKRKTRRPIALRRPMHVVLRATRAKGKWSLLSKEHARFIDHLLAKVTRAHGVVVYEKANVGNHLHLLLRAKTRKGFQNFLKSFAGQVAQKVTGARKGISFGRFWNLTAYTRIVAWGKAFARVKRYVHQNHLEATGIIPYTPRPLTKKTKSPYERSEDPFPRPARASSAELPLSAPGDEAFRNCIFEGAIAQIRNDSAAAFDHDQGEESPPR